MEIDIDHPQVFLICSRLPDHPEMNRIITGVWRTYEGAKLALDDFKKHRIDFEYAIASYPIREEGQIW